MPLLCVCLQDVDDEVNYVLMEPGKEEMERSKSFHATSRKKSSLSIVYIHMFVLHYNILEIKPVPAKTFFAAANVSTPGMT